MIKLIVIARCIPEDVYLRSLDQPAPVFAGEKKFSLVVRDPNTWYIGRLAIEIRNRYESLYKRPLGQIKYLKDAEDDCDLDPELSVADLLVDEGRAAKDGVDQKRVIKVIQEQGRAIRQGSVIPDLTPLHYQPPTRPPVPKFPGPEKRPLEGQDTNTNGHAPKRRRLDQIEEDDAEHVISSIEDNGNALNGNIDELDVETKQESPEIPSPWVNTRPATRDELELLPEPPSNWQQRTPRAGISVSLAQQGRSPVIRESAQPEEAGPNHQPTRAVNKEAGSLSGRFARQHSLTAAHAPITPPDTINAAITPGSHPVSMLNGMKSQSPALRKSTSTPASRYRKRRNDIYDFPQSDIEDSQMSPRSRSRSSMPKFTPTLVQSHAPDVDTQNLHRAQAKVRTLGATQKEHDKPNSGTSARVPSQTSSIHVNHTTPLPNQQSNWQNGGFANLVKPSSESTRLDIRPSAVGQDSVLGTDETWSVQGDGTKKRKKRSRSGLDLRRSNGGSSTTRSSSMSSSAVSQGISKINEKKKKKLKRIAPLKVADLSAPIDGEDDEEDGDVDSPGAQLEESLRRSSPVRKKISISLPSASISRSRSTTEAATSTSAQKTTPTDKLSDIERSPDSVSDVEGPVLPLKPIPKRPRKKNLVSAIKKGKQPADDRRCFTCWSRSTRCDNAVPKCNTCEKLSKNCQIYSMTKEAAEKEKADRKAGRSTRKSSTLLPNANTKMARSKLQVDDNSASGSEEADEDEKDEDDGEHDEVSEVDTELETNIPPTAENSASTKQPPLLGAPKSNSTTTKQNGMQDAMNSAASKGKPALSATSTGNNSTPNGQRIGGKQTTPRTASLREKEQAIKRPISSSNIGNIQSDTAKAQPHKRQNQIIATGHQSNRNPSVESYAMSNTKILPPGMDQEQYDLLVLNRATLTEAQRKENKKLLNQKLQKQKEKQPTPLVPRSQSSQDPTTGNTRPTSSTNGSEKVPSSTQASSDRPDLPQSGQTDKAPTKKLTPAAASRNASNSTTAKSQQAQDSLPKTKPSARLSLHPTIATTASSVDAGKHQNPPFRQPQRKSLLSTTGSTTPTSLIGASTKPRSIAELRASQARLRNAESGTSTPQATGGIFAAAKIAAKIAAAKKDSQQKPKGFSLDDDDEEEGSETDSESESSDEEEGDIGKEKKKPEDVMQAALRRINGAIGNSGAAKNLIVRREEPSETGSDVTDSGSEAESNDD